MHRGAASYGGTPPPLQHGVVGPASRPFLQDRMVGPVSQPSLVRDGTAGPASRPSPLPPRMSPMRAVAYRQPLQGSLSSPACSRGSTPTSPSTTATVPWRPELGRLTNMPGAQSVSPAVAESTATSAELQRATEEAWSATAEAERAMAEAKQAAAMLRQARMERHELRLYEEQLFAAALVRRVVPMLRQWRLFAHSRRMLLHVASQLVARMGLADRRAKLLASQHGWQLIGLRPQSTAMAAWRDAARQRKVVAFRAARALHSATGRAWLVWCAGWREASHRHDGMRRALGHLVHRQIAMGWLCWATPTLARRHRRQTLRRALAALTSRALVRAWRGWCEAASARAARVCGMRRGIAGFVHRRLRRGWGSWAGVVRSRWMLRHSMARLVRRGLVRGFEGWSWQAGSLGTLRQSARRVILRARNRGLSHGLVAWLQLVRARYEGMALLRDAVARMSSRRLARAHRTWLETSQTAEGGAQLLRAARFCTSRELASGWLAWRDFGRARAAQRHAATRLVHRALGLGFGSWILAVAELGQARRSLHRALARLRSRHFARSWGAWSAMALARSDALRMLRRGVGYMARRHLAEGWSGWRFAAAHHSGASHAVHRALRHLAQRAQSCAWHTWAHNARALRMLHVSIAFMTKSALVRGLNGWMASAALWAQQYAAMHAVAMRMCERRLARGWSTWRHSVALTDTTTPATRAMLHWTHRQLASGWEGWLSYTANVVLARRASAFLLHSGLARGFLGWGHEAARLQQRRERLYGALTRLHAQQLAGSWTIWSERARAHLQAMQTLRWASSRILKHQLARGFDGWRCASLEMAASVRKIRGAILRLCSRQLARSWAGWAWATESRLEQMRILRFAAARIGHRKLATAFALWQDLAHGLVDTSMTRAARHLLLRGLSCGWHRWSAHASGQRMLTRSLNHVWGRGRSRAFRSWCMQASMQKRSRHVGGRALAYIVHHRLAYAWRAWASMASARAHQLRLVRRGLSFVANREQAQCWRVWRGALSTDDPMSRAARHLLHRELAGSLHAWLQLAGHLRMLRRSARFLCDRSRARGFVSWRSEVDRLGSQRMAMHRALARLLHRRLANGWQAWTAMMEARRSLWRYAPLTLALRAAFEHFYAAAQAMARAAGLARSFHPEWRAMRCALRSLHALVGARDRVRMGVRRWRQRRLPHALRTWMVVAGQHAMRSRSLAHLLRGGLSRGWNSWCAVVGIRHAELKQVRRSLAIWQARGLSASLCTWREQTNALVGGRRLLARVACRALCAALDAWSGMAMQRRSLFRAATAFRSTALRRALSTWYQTANVRMAAVNFTSRTAHYLLSCPRVRRAFVSWVHQYDHATSCQRAQVAICQRALNSDILRGFNTWALWCARRGGAVAMLTQGTANFSNRMVGMALRTWRSVVENLAEARHWATYFLHRQLHRALNTWSFGAADRLHALRVMRAGATSMSKPGLHRAWCAWADAASAGQHLSRVRLRVAQHWAQRHQARAWHSWHSLMKAWQHHRSVCHSIVHGGVRRAMNTWGAASFERTRLKQTMRACVLRLAQRACWLAMGSWVSHHEMCVQAARCRKLARVGLLRWRRRELNAAITSWILVALEREHSVAIAADAWRGVSCRRAWRAWSGLASIARIAHIVRSRDATVYRHAAHRKLRAAIARWFQRVCEYGVAGSRRELVRGWKTRATATCSRAGVLPLLNAAQRRAWPKAWQEYFGWSMTWREVPWWLGELGIAVPHDAAELLSVLREGSVYIGLLRRIHAGPHRCAYPGCQHRCDAASSRELSVLENAVTPMPREGGWIGLVRSFLHSEHALNVLGGSGRSLEILCAVELESKPVQHLSLLTSLRVVLEMDNSNKWARFVGSLSGPSLSDARRPRFTPRDPRDDYTHVDASAPASFVCLGCATPRILMRNLKCGKCGLVATVPAEEYLATFSHAVRKHETAPRVWNLASTALSHQEATPRVWERGSASYDSVEGFAAGPPPTTPVGSVRLFDKPHASLTPRSALLSSTPHSPAPLLTPRSPAPSTVRRSGTYTRGSPWLGGSYRH